MMKPTSVRDTLNFARSSFLSGSKNKWGVLVSVGIGTFMSALDGSVVNTVLPVINNSLADNVAAVEWVVTIYLLVLSGLLLSFGRLGDIQGHKKVYLTGFLIFILGSVICGLSNTLFVLVLFRGIQAMGAAMLQSNSPAIITKSFPGTQRGQALGLVATMTYLGLTIGPSFGGWLAQQISWRAVFYINIPVGMLALFLSYKFIPTDKVTGVSEKFDLSGAITFTSGLVFLLLALNQGHTLGWNSPIILGLFIGAILLLTLFTRIENNKLSPMLDLNLFSSRLFTASTGSAVLNYICIYSVLFLLPFYLISGRGYTPAQAGLILTAQPIIMAIIAPISGSLSDRIGTRIPATFGMSLLAIGLFMLSMLTANTSQNQIILALGIVGLGTGIFISPNNSALMGAAPAQRQGIAAGVLATARNMGMVLGVGMAGAIFSTILGTHGINEITILVDAIRTSFGVTGVVAIIGIVVSWIR